MRWCNYGNKRRWTLQNTKWCKYEIFNGQIMVEHENGYYGYLYGKSSMSINNGKEEVLHTGSRNINTPNELYELLSGMPEMMEGIKKLIKE